MKTLFLQTCKLIDNDGRPYFTQTGLVPISKQNVGNMERVVFSTGKATKIMHAQTNTLLCYAYDTPEEIRDKLLEDEKEPELIEVNNIIDCIDKLINDLEQEEDRHSLKYAERLFLIEAFKGLVTAKTFLDLLHKRLHGDEE